MSEIDINLYKAIFHSFKEIHRKFVKPSYYEWDDVPVFLKAHQKVISKYYSIYKFYVLSDSCETKFELEVKFNVSRKTNFLFCNVTKTIVEDRKVVRVVKYRSRYCKSNCKDEHISGGVPMSWQNL